MSGEKKETVSGGAAPPAAGEDESILSHRLGYGNDTTADPVLLCADEQEKQFLLSRQHEYRRAPSLAITRIREASAQLRIIGSTYSQFGQTEQTDFIRQVSNELTVIQKQLDEMKGIRRPQVSPRTKKLTDARNGAILQMVEAFTLGMPLEVWKTRMGRFRNETTLQALNNIYRQGGGGLSGVRAFWAGTSAKMVESGTKGAVLMFAKEFIKDSTLTMGISPTAAGFIAGAGGGICQVSVMGPCTFMVTSMVTQDKNSKRTMLQHIRNTWKAEGIRGFYPGGVAIAFRQATNWASRQGFTDAVREMLKRYLYPENPSTAKLTMQQEVTAGIIGGALACWNHPFEVARIEAQARAAAGEARIGMLTIFRTVYAEWGMAGLFKGVIPRLGLGMYQTVFMVSGANIIRNFLNAEDGSSGH